MQRLSGFGQVHDQFMEGVVIWSDTVSEFVGYRNLAIVVVQRYAAYFVVLRFDENRVCLALFLDRD